MKNSIPPPSKSIPVFSADNGAVISQYKVCKWDIMYYSQIERCNISMRQRLMFWQALVLVVKVCASFHMFLQIYISLKYHSVVLGWNFIIQTLPERWLNC